LDESLIGSGVKVYIISMNELLDICDYDLFSKSIMTLSIIIMHINK